MIFITYWELNPDFYPSDLVEMTQTIMNKGLVPFEGVKQLAWYIASEHMGITVEGAECEEAFLSNSVMWRIVKPDIFKSIKISPRMEVDKILLLVIRLGKKIKS